MIALIAVASAIDDRAVALERVDLFSEVASDFWVDDAPRLGVGPRATTLRWAEQLTVAVSSPRASMVLGVSMSRQTVSVRRPLTYRFPVYASGGVVTRLGLPAGAVLGAEVWLGPVRVALGVHAQSAASWANPRWDSWRILPGVGVGLGDVPMRF